MNAFVGSPPQSLVAQPKQPVGLNQHNLSMDDRPLDMLDDASLLHLLTLNQLDALSELYDRYSRLLYSIALKSAGDQAVAEEIVQDVFVRVWKKANTYDARIGKVSTWLASITRHRVIDEFRRGKRRPDKTSLIWEDIAASDAPYSPGPEEETELAFQNKFVRDALNALSAGEREALDLAYFKGYSHSEIATHLELPLGTVKTRIRTAMQKLRLVLSRSFQEDG
jgi:RNA polymerase sigma-70 factor (ECF subfamily)